MVIIGVTRNVAWILEVDSIIYAQQYAPVLAVKEKKEHDVVDRRVVATHIRGQTK